MTATEADDATAPADDAVSSRVGLLDRLSATGRSFAIATVFGIVAAFAPMGLTGSTTIDAVERFVLVTLVTFLGAHAHRWSWFVAGALVAGVIRDVPLLVALAGLAAAVVSARSRRRSKDLGAIAVGLLAMAVVWAPGHNVGWPTLPVVVLAALLVVVSGYPNVRRRHRRKVRNFILVLVLLVVLSGGAAAFAVGSAYGDVGVGSAAARDALIAVRQGDTEAATAHLATAEDHLGSADSVLSRFTRPAAFVPGLAQQADAITTSVDQARSITDVASVLVETNYHDLRYEGTIDLDLVRGLREPTASVAATLARADAEISSLQDRWLIPQLEEQVEAFADDIADARSDTDLAVDALAVAPDLLGADGPRRYLVAFLTPAELRGAGGFVGSWAELTARNGDVELSASGRVAELIYARPEGSRQLNGPEDYIERYGRFDPQDFIQDATYSPHWPSNAEVLADLYEQSTGRAVAGVLGVDPTGLAAILELTGPVAVPSLANPLDATNAVGLLTRQQYLLFPDRAEREDLLAEAVDATFSALVEASLPAPERLGQVLGAAARGRHLQMWSPVPAEQAFFARIHADSALEIPPGSDGFSVVQQNVGNNKIDAYLQRSVTYEVTVDGDDGSLSGMIRVVLENRVEDLSWPDAVVDNQRGAPRGTNVASVALHAPWTVTSSTIDGETELLGPGRELGMNAWDTPVLQIPPGGEVVLEAQISGAVDLSNGYRLQLVPQPLTSPEVVDVWIHLENGTFGTPEGDIEPLEVTAKPQVIHLQGRLERAVEVVVPTSR